MVGRSNAVSGGASIEWQQVDIVARDGGKFKYFDYTFDNIGDKNIILYNYYSELYYASGLLVSGRTDAFTDHSIAGYEITLQREGSSAVLRIEGMGVPMSQITINYVIF